MLRAIRPRTATDMSSPATRPPPRQPPGLAERAFQLALSLHHAGQHPGAKQQYRAVLALNRDHVGALHNLGLILIQEGNIAEGVRFVRRALARHPRSAEAHNTLGMALQAEGRHRDAIAEYRSAMAIRPNYPEALNNLGSVFEETAEPDKAAVEYGRAVALKPDYANACHKLGVVLEQLGRFDEGRAALAKAVALMPRRAEFHRSLADSQRFTAGDPRLAAMLALAQHLPTLPVDDQVELNFALGKAYADLGEHARSFGHYLDGNAIKRRNVRYDEVAALGFLRRVQDHFTPALIDANRGRGTPSPAPVFILGMPRSGSTLVEQILASHPKVFAAGELTHFGRAITALGATKLYPEMASALTHDQLRTLGTRYVAAIRAKAGPNPERITDKMPMNFPFVGLIHLALPNATIIHTRRDPVDCCLSNFTNLFAHGQLLQTYELGELGRYYRAYDTLMQHWREVLPGVMLDVQYEELVGDFERQARRIVAHCGLDWDDACLRFHETRRPVQTASVRQVRQPVYASSVGRWRHYKDMLEPLLRELGVAA